MTREEALAQRRAYVNVSAPITNQITPDDATTAAIAELLASGDHRAANAAMDRALRGEKLTPKPAAAPPAEPDAIAAERDSLKAERDRMEAEIAELKRKQKPDDDAEAARLLATMRDDHQKEFAGLPLKDIQAIHDALYTSGPPQPSQGSGKPPDTSTAAPLSLEKALTTGNHQKINDAFDRELEKARAARRF